MSIRMKEWGMMRAPADAVRIPVQGLMGWDSAAQGLGDGVSKVVQGMAGMMQEGRDRVQKTGGLAQFSRRLKDIDTSTRDELADRDVNDWEYAWRAANEPLVNEAVAELPPAARQAGEELARIHCRRAVLEGLRDKQLQEVKDARSQWQGMLDSAIEQGDEDQALMWLEHGKDVFVAPAKEEELARQVRSRARLSRWRQDFSTSPLETLERYHHASDEELPAGEAETQDLAAMARKYTQEGRRALISQVAGKLQESGEPPADLWERAERAGLISPEQFNNATGTRRKLEDVERCRWYRRVDEVEEDDESRQNLMLDIITSPLPAKDRSELLDRLKTSACTARADRLTLSRNLWNLYNAGAFGCPGDAMAGRRMAALQRNGARLLAAQGAEATAAWVQEQGRGTDRWVCFSDLHKPNA